jgi:hypothetical protein
MCDTKTLLLTHLTTFDADRFHAAKLFYSGEAHDSSTYGWYIATWVSELAPALVVLGWAQIELTVTPHAVFARARREPLLKLKKPRRLRRRTGPRKIRLRDG